MIRRIQLVPIVLALGLVSGSAHAALQGRDLNGSVGSFEAYYDTDLDITWLADANYAKTSGYHADGNMYWADANTWAVNLSLVDAVNNLTYDNWRLPTTLQPDASCGTQAGGSSYGYGCTGSEMGHLFYSELGGTAGQSILTNSDSDLAKFTNFQAHSFYWSGTDAPNTDAAWFFGFGNGGQSADYKDHIIYYALAVSPGDVGAVAAVPEAQTYALMLAGLGLIGWRARRRG